MKRLVLFVAVSASILSGSAYAQSRADRAFEVVVAVNKWCGAIRKAIGPTVKAGKAESNALGELSDSHSGLAVAPLIAEMRAARHDMMALQVSGSAEDRQALLEKLRANQETIRIVSDGIRDIQQDLKSIADIPSSRATTAGPIQIWYFQELPALQKELAALQRTNELKLREFEADSKNPKPQYLDQTKFAALQARTREAKSRTVTADNAAAMLASLSTEIAGVEAEIKESASKLNNLHQLGNDAPTAERREHYRGYEGALRQVLGEQMALRHALAVSREAAKKLLAPEAGASVSAPSPAPTQVSGVQLLNAVASYMLEHPQQSSQLQALMLQEHVARLDRFREADANRWAAAEAYRADFRTAQAGQVRDLEALLSQQHGTLEEMLRAAEARAQYSSSASRERMQRRLDQNRAAFLAAVAAERSSWQQAQENAIQIAASRGWLATTSSSENGSQASPAASPESSKSSKPEQRPKTEPASRGENPPASAPNFHWLSPKEIPGDFGTDERFQNYTFLIQMVRSGTDRNGVPIKDSKSWLWEMRK